MDTNTVAMQATSFIESVFNKEGIAIFVLFCLAVFAIAVMLVVWAYDNGQFENIEEAKYDMLNPDGVFDEVIIKS